MSAHKVLLLAWALLVVACGGGASPASTGSTAPPTAASPPVAVSELVGTAWNVTLLDVGGTMTGVWPHTEITLVFESASKMSGSAGCSKYNGNYEVEGDYDRFQVGVVDPNDGQAIRFFALGVREEVCEDEVMEQEGYYLNALRRSGRWLFAREALVLRTADGLFRIEAQPVAPAS